MDSESVEALRERAARWLTVAGMVSDKGIAAHLRAEAQKLLDRAAEIAAAIDGALSRIDGEES